MKPRRRPQRGRRDEEEVDPLNLKETRKRNNNKNPDSAGFYLTSI